MIVEGKSIDFRLADDSDAPFILKLRLDETKTQFLSKVSNDLSAQIAWMRSYKERERKQEEYYFIITDKSNKALGTVRLYDFKGDSFCWGSWLIDDSAPITTGIESALLVYEFAFYRLQFKRSHFDVRKKNVKVRAFHERMGARQVREDEMDSFYEYSKEAYESFRLRYSKYLP